MRWFLNPSKRGARSESRQHSCDQCQRAAAEPENPGTLCEAMRRAYNYAMRMKRQTVQRQYAEYMSLMPPYVGGLLILRGIRGSKTAVEEVHGCALRSAEGADVMTYVNDLLLNYEDSVRAEETIAPFAFPGQEVGENFLEALEDTLTKIMTYCEPVDPTNLEDCAKTFDAIRGLVLSFTLTKIRSLRAIPAAQSNVVQPVPAVQSAAEPTAAGPSAAAKATAVADGGASPVSPASQDDPSGLGDLEGAGDPKHVDFTEAPISPTVHVPNPTRREIVRTQMARDDPHVAQIRQLSLSGLSHKNAAVTASDDAKASSTSAACAGHVDLAQTAVQAVLGALSAGGEAFTKLLLPQNRQSVQQHLDNLADAAGAAEAAVNSALAHQRELLKKEEEVAAAEAEAAAKLVEAEKAEAERQAAEKRQDKARKRPVVDDDDDDDDQPELKKLKATDYFTDERLGKKDAKMNVSDAHQVSSTLERSGRVLLKVPRGAMKSLVDAFCPFAAAETTPWTAVFERDVDMMGDDIPADLLKLWPRRQSVVKERGKAWAGVGKESVQPFLKGLPHVIAKKFGEEPKEASLLRSAPLTRKLLEEVQRWDRYRETKHPFPDPPPGEEGPWPSWQACHMDTTGNGWACIVALGENVWVRLWPRHDVGFGLSNEDVFDAKGYEDVEIPAGHAFFFEAARRHAGYAMLGDRDRVHMQWDDRKDLAQETFQLHDDDVAKHFRWVDECAGFPLAARGGDA